MRQRVRQVCPVKKALGFFSRRQRAMPFAVRFVRRRRTQQKNTKACGRAVRKLAPQNSAPFVLCPATVRPRKENRGTFGRDGMPCARLPWQNGDNTRRAVFARSLLRGDAFCHYGERPRPFCPDGVAQFEQCARGRGKHVRTASHQSAGLQQCARICRAVCR